MRIDSTHRRWILFTLALLIAAVAAYVPYVLRHSINGPRGSTWPGLAYGGVALALMLYATALGLRRKVRSRNFGRAETWLRGHVWLGLLAYPLVFLHAGFRLGGSLTVVLIVLFTIVVLTGIHGIIVQTIIPRMMTVQVPNEVVYDQMPTYLARLQEEALRAVTDVAGPVPGSAPAGAKAKVKEPVEGSEPLMAFYQAEVAPYLVSGRGRLATVPSRKALFAHARALAGVGTHDALTHIETLCEERRTLAVQTSLHRWLHGWLVIHLPAAAALMILSVIHAVAAVYY